MKTANSDNPEGYDETTASSYHDTLAVEIVARDHGFKCV